MIDILTTPKELELCGNPIAFTVNGDNYIQSAGSVPYCVLTKVGNFSAGQSFDIIFMDYTLTFLIGTGDNDTGLYVPALASIITLVEYLSLNYLLTKYYTVDTYDADSIIITSKSAGSAYNITYDVDLCAALEGDAITGVDAVIAENYKILFQAFYKGRFKDYESLPEQLIDADESGNATIYVGELLKNAFLPGDLPDFNTAYLKICSEAIYKYYFRFAERYGDPASVKRLYSCDELWVLNGKMFYDKFPGHDFINELIFTEKFLTNKTQPVEIYKEAQEFLYWINTTGRTLTQIAVVFYRFTTENPNDPLQVIKSWIRDIEPMDVVCVPAGLIQTLIYTSLHDWKYYVFLVEEDPPNDPVRITEYFQFKVITKRSFNHQLIFKNDYGVFETLIVEKVQNKFETDTKVYQKSLSYDYTTPDAELRSVVEGADNKFTVRTGFIPKNDADHICELLTNGEVYIIGNIQYIPIIVDKGTVELSDEADDVYSVKLNYRYAFNGKISPGA